MDIKEQIAKEIVEYDFTGFNPKWTECANKSHWLNLANKIIKLFEQAGYVQLQAGEDGLLADEEIQELYDSDDYGDGFALWKEIAIRQKALDDKEKEEAVKKVFDWFLSRSYPEDDVIEITFSKTELDTFKQTLEELK